MTQESGIWARDLGPLARWFGHRFSQPTASPVEPSEPAEPVVGLVLSGGGARSSFQLGALRYLYDREDITPSVFTGTSVGSILASVLAQYPDHERQRHALAELERIWLGMTHNSDMFTELPWFARLREHMPTWRKVMALRQRSAPRVSLGASLTSALQRPIQAVERLTAERTERAEMHDGVPSVVSAGDTPVDLAAQDTTPVTTATVSDRADRPTGWNPASALEALATLWEAGRASTDLDLIMRGAQEERSTFRPGPFVDQLLDPAVFDPARTATSGVELRVAVVGLESGALRYVTGAGQLRDREDRPIEHASPVDLVGAIRASCAIPGVFPPVPLGEEHYVDGGVRESLPAEVALEHLGVQRCYAVVASPPGVPQDRSFAHKDMLAIVLRSTSGIMSDELLRDEVARARAAGATVIEPELDIHDIVTIDPGLISIAVDYGYLRAADVCEQASPERQSLTRGLISLRRLIWTMEDELLNPESPATSGHDGTEDDGISLEGLADLKLRLRELLTQTTATHLPPGAQDWWRTWERHQFEITEDPDWVEG